jgi:hypothetical protein
VHASSGGTPHFWGASPLETPYPTTSETVTGVSTGLTHIYATHTHARRLGDMVDVVLINEGSEAVDFELSWDIAPVCPSQSSATVCSGAARPPAPRTRSLAEQGTCRSDGRCSCSVDYSGPAPLPTPLTRAGSKCERKRQLLELVNVYGATRAGTDVSAANDGGGGESRCAS